MKTLNLIPTEKSQSEKNEQIIKNVCFPVEKVAQKDLNPNFIYGSEYTHAIIGKIGDQKHYLNACSNRYTLVENQAFIPDLYQILSDQFGGENIEVNARNFQNSIFNFDFIIKSQEHYFGGNAADPLNFKVSAQNSYNGKQNYNFEFGNQVYRQICTNGLHAWKLESLFSVKGKHTENIKLQLKNFDVALKNALDQDIFTKIAASFIPMAETVVTNWQDRLIEVMNVANIATTTNNMAFLHEVIADEARITNNNQVNNFLLYNGLNNLLFNTGSKASQSALEKKDQKVYELLTV